MCRVSGTARRVITGLGRAGLASGALAALVLATPAGAVDLKTVGSWTAFRAETSDGVTICGIATTLAEGRVLYLKWYRGDDALTVQAYRESWQIPPHVTPKVSLTFARNTPWTATGYEWNTVSSIVQFTVQRADVKPFINEFTTSSMATYEFQGGSEPAWQLSMAGSAGALDVMAQCAEDVAGAAFRDTPLGYLRRPKPSFGGSPTSGATGRTTRPL